LANLRGATSWISAADEFGNLRRRIWSTDLTDFGNLVRQVWLLISSISFGPGSSVEAAAFAH
jgi:hypothetical protein